MRSPIVALFLLCSFAIGCKEDAKSDGDSKSSKKPKSEKSEGSPKGPKDVDVDSLSGDLKCSEDDDRDGCKCLREFGSAKAFKDLPDEGRSVWVGYTHGLGGPADGKKKYFFVQIEPGKADQGAIDDADLKDEALIEFKGSARTLIPDNAEEDTEAKALIKALKAGDDAPKGSGAVKFMKTAKPASGFRAMAKSTGRSMVIAWSKGKSFLRADRDRTLMVEFSPSGGLIGDPSDKQPAAKAFCTELWKVR